MHSVMKFAKTFVLGALAGAFGLLGAASAATIDFESLTPGVEISGDDLGGVTITAGANPIIVESFCPGCSGNTIATDPFTTADPFTATFGVAGVTSVSVDMGDFGADADNLFLEAYDSDDNLLTSDTTTLGSGVSGLLTLTVSTIASIAYVVFGSTGSFANSIYADNLVFNSGSEIPIPAAFPLMLVGLGALGAMVRRRARKA